MSNPGEPKIDSLPQYDHRQAIVTRYLGPTDHRGSRIKAIAYAGSLTVPWDYALSEGENHYAAARALAVKHGWVRHGTASTRMVPGGLPDGRGNVYVLIG